MSDQITVRRLTAVTAVLGLLIAVPAYVFISRMPEDRLASPAPSLDASRISGAYRNEQCGTIRLANGRVFLGDSSAPFKFIDIKGEPLIIPEATLSFDRNGGDCRIRLVGSGRYMWPYKPGSFDVLDDSSETLVTFAKVARER